MKHSFRAENLSFERRLVFTKIGDLSPNPRNARTHLFFGLPLALPEVSAVGWITLLKEEAPGLATPIFL
jgi:hypothetical protein